MLIEELDLENRLQEVLGYDITGALHYGELPAPVLSEAEKKQFVLMRNERRRESWLRGRHVLKDVLKKMGHASDTTLIDFPHKSFSISHSQNYAIAVGLEAEAVQGIGVDLEFMRATRDGMMRFFLSEEESEWLGELSAPERNKQIIRLWTVKEAVFKADPENASQTMIKYRLTEPAALVGIALPTSGSLLVFKYASLYVDNAWISVALSLAPGDKNVS